MPRLPPKSTHMGTNKLYMLIVVGHFEFSLHITYTSKIKYLNAISYIHRPIYEHTCSERFYLQCIHTYMHTYTNT